MLDLRKFFVVFILGLTEGLTEFLPISSTGHLILISNLLKHIYNVDNIFFTIIQLGSILSIILVFWNRLYHMSVACITRLFVKKYCKCYGFCFLHILVGTLPGIIVGMLFFKKIKLVFDLMYVIYGLVIGGVFLLFADKYLPKVPRVSRIDNITYVQAFLIGCFQCLAFFPGFSRSGSTIGGGLLVGLNRRVSSEFSFFLAVPIICGATIFTIYHYRFYISIEDIFFLFIGCIIAFCISVFIVKVFLKIVQNVSFVPFVIYRFLLAASIYYWNIYI